MSRPFKGIITYWGWSSQSKTDIRESTSDWEPYKESTSERGEALGSTKLYVEEDVVAEGPMRTQLAFFTLCGDGLCVGRDSGDAVSKEYKAPATFKGGTILQVEVSTGDDQYLDLEKEAHALLARE